jgi:hypothetical protein
MSERIILVMTAGGADMAKTKQFIVTVENRPGAVAEIARTLGNGKVNILSLLLLGKAEEMRGTVQLVVDDARRAKKALDESGLTYQEARAEEHEIPNKPGALAQHLDKLAAKGVNLNSIFATAPKDGKKAVVVYTADVEAKAATA